MVGAIWLMTWISDGTIKPRYAPSALILSTQLVLSKATAVDSTDFHERLRLYVHIYVRLVAKNK